LLLRLGTEPVRVTKLFRTNTANVPNRLCLQINSIAVAARWPAPDTLVA
jgi:hypothetical protein